MTQILLIDDDRSLHHLLGQFLEDAGYSVLHATSGTEGLKLLYQDRPQIILVDVMMPRIDGFETAQRIRELTDVPIIFLTARSEEADRLQGFRVGADDYIVKPFSFPELAARIEAILRRVTAQPGEGDPPTILVRGPFSLDTERHLITYQGEALILTPTEYRLLEVFMRRPNVIFSQEQLVTAVWGPEYADETGYIRRYIWHLRKKIEPDPDVPQYILTERGFGYRFVV